MTHPNHQTLWQKVNHPIREEIIRALKEQPTIQKAADDLGTSRQRLHLYMRRHGLKNPRRS